MKYLLLLTLLIGCAKSSVSPPWTPDAAALDAAASTIPAGESGWPSDSDCDAALWAGEARAAGDLAVEESAALQPDGRPTRLPGADCGPAGTPGVPAGGNSTATTSTDMQLGTILGLLAAGDVAALERLQAYADAQSGFVGTPESDISDVYMKPGTRSLLARAISKLGGQADVTWLIAPIVYGVPTADYQVHLALISLIIQARTSGLGDAERAYASELYATNPADALAAYVAGAYAASQALVVSADWTPPTYVRGGTPAATAAYVATHRNFVIHLLLGEFG